MQIDVRTAFGLEKCGVLFPDIAFALVPQFSIWSTCILLVNDRHAARSRHYHSITRAVLDTLCRWVLLRLLFESKSLLYENDDKYLMFTALLPKFLITDIKLHKIKCLLIVKYIVLCMIPFDPFVGAFV